MKIIKVITNTQVFTADNFIQADGCLSLMVKNEAPLVGGATITLFDRLTIAPGDPPITFPNNSFGEYLCERYDSIKLTFGAGTKLCVVTKDVVLKFDEEKKPQQIESDI